jgi:hypothetical protein
VDLGLLHPRETIEGVIASDRLALKVGSSKQVVDGTDETLAHKAEFSLLPNRCRARALNALVDWFREVSHPAATTPIDTRR